jgi:hypothetical protein
VMDSCVNSPETKVMDRIRLRINVTAGSISIYRRVAVWHLPLIFPPLLQ